MSYYVAQHKCNSILISIDGEYLNDESDDDENEMRTSAIMNAKGVEDL